MQYYYSIAGLRVNLDIPFPVTIQRESKNFIFSGQCPEKPDLNCFFRPVDALPPMPGGGHWEIDQYHLDTPQGRQIYHCPVRSKPPYALVQWPVDRPDTILCLYLPGAEEYMNFSHNLCDLIGLENLLQFGGGMILHSSFIRWQGCGILFSAPSGTGKSTQAELWARHENAEILNGDRAGLRPGARGWTAYGLPYAGSSGIYRNESAPVLALVVLEQGKSNSLCPLDPVQAFRRLYPEISAHSWDKQFTENITERLFRLVTEIPVYLLRCLPDRGAVQLLKRFLPLLPKGD